MIWKIIRSRIRWGFKGLGFRDFFKDIADDMRLHRIPK